MTAAGLVLIALAGIVHLGIFAIESLLWRRSRTWRMFGIRDEATADAARPWALNQGFYNLFLGVGAIGGAIAATTMPWMMLCVQWTPECAASQVRGELADVPGLIVAAFCAACMVGAAIVLQVSGGRGSTVPSLVQGLVPLVGLVLLGPRLVEIGNALQPG